MAAIASKYDAPNDIAEHVFATYEEMKAQNNAIDFIDMLSLVIQKLRNNVPVLRIYQQQYDTLILSVCVTCCCRFQYVMVDEFQDTNTLQLKLLHLLCKGVPQKQPSSTIGDNLLGGHSVEERNGHDHFYHHDRITIVGDPDQSIYGWRDANSKHTLLL
jgi:DNA helicase-2/ATP-dependent DNA helicase PcrA